jgi:glycopeptide antibiotics resistance protein
MVVSGRARTVTRVLLVVYLVGLARVTLWPRLAPDDSFDLLRTVLAWLGSHGFPLSFGLTEFLANNALFVPFGILVGLMSRLRPWTVVALGLATSGLIELAQLVFLPDRVSDVRDLEANTLGTAVGVAVLLAAHARRREPVPAG